MKYRSTVALMRSRQHGFTLLELLVVMVIIAILAALTLGAFRFAQESSARNRTISTHGAITAALEQYKEKFGEYPEPASLSEVDKFGGKELNIGGAHMLYQAITADGSSAIHFETAPAGGAAESDGKVSDAEMENSITASPLPKSVIFPPNAEVGMSRPRLVIDGWSRPFQYVKADAKTPANNKAINPTYDLWSFGPLKGGEGGSPDDSLDAKRDTGHTAAWIKNW